MDRATRVVAATLLVLVATSCGSEDAAPDGRGQHEPVGSTSESSPFKVGHGPDGYRLVRAGQGSISQTWSSDSFGDDEPVTVLAPAGEGPGGPDEVRVSLTGFEGFQGGLAQASRGYMSDEREDFELDGSPAIYMPPQVDGGEEWPADLVVVAGDDLAVRVSSADGTREELTEIARAVEPREDHLLAPPVPDPPDDLEVVGSADADVAISLINQPRPSTESLPAGDRAHSAVWAEGEESDPWTSETGTLTVTTLPGQALDLDATEASLHRQSRWWGEVSVTGTEVGGRAAVVLDTADTEDRTGLRAILTSAPSGDLLLVVAHGPERPDEDGLVTVAASVEPADPEEWEALVLEARGGPGLHPDDGAVELERGTAGDVDWLFQARVDDGSMYGSFSSGDEDTTGQFLADPCLKLSTDERACPRSSSGTAGSDLVVEIHDGGEDSEVPGFAMVMTTAPAATVRVHSEDAGALDATLHPLPGEKRRAAIVVTDADLDLFLPECIGPGDGVEPKTMELLDESGQRMPCP